MESVSVPLRSGGKKMRKRRELDALVAHSLAKRACSTSKRQAGNGINSQDQLLSQSTDDQEEYSWSKVRMSTRHPKHFSFIRTCAPLLFIFSVLVLFSVMYWLYFDLREQLSDHRIKIQQVSAISLNVPEALQKWHESSKALEENQTDISRRLLEIQQRIDGFEKEIFQLKETIHKKEEVLDSDKSVNLKDTVAGFGAEIKALRIDVEALNGHYHDVQKIQQDDKSLLDKLATNVEMITNSTASNLNNNFNNKTLDLYKTLNDQCSNGLRNISVQLATANDTFSQKIKVLDDQIREHNTKLDGLTESYANVSSHVTSVESEWPKFKQANQRLDNANAKFDNDISLLKNSTLYWSSIVKDIQSNLAMKNQRGYEKQNYKNDNMNLQPNADGMTRLQLKQSDPMFTIKENNLNNNYSQASIQSIKDTIFPSTLTTGISNNLNSTAAPSLQSIPSQPLVNGNNVSINSNNSSGSTAALSTPPFMPN